MTLDPGAAANSESAQIQRILESRTFRSSAIHRDLLTYLARKCFAGEADDLKEYTVGIDALGKPSTYDPRQDSSVRMSIGRLRQKLADYYRTEGASDPILVDLPKGGFRLTFESRAAHLPALTWRTAPVSWKAAITVLAAIAMIATAAAVWFATRPAKTAPIGSNVALSPELKQIWDPLLSTGRPLAVCLSVPVFANLTGFDSVVGPFTADWSSLSNSHDFTSLIARLHASSTSPSYDYTNVATATGAFRLGQFLSGRAPNILLTRSDLMTGPEVAMDNLVFVGTPQGNPQLQGLAADRQFVFGTDGIRNLHPAAGEAAVLPLVASEGGFASTHALITLAPSANGTGVLLYLTGSTEAGIIAAVDAVTNPSVTKKIFPKLAGSDGKLPRYYQVVITARSMEEMPIDISWAAGKPLER